MGRQAGTADRSRARDGQGVHRASVEGVAIPRRWDTARDGYVILDSDLHRMEPDNLWARYLEEKGIDIVCTYPCCSSAGVVAVRKYSTSRSHSRSTAYTIRKFSCCSRRQR